MPVARLSLAALALCALPGHLLAVQQAAFRPPAVPLIANDPFLSIWSEADHLTDDAPRHWTHHPHTLLSLIRIDGATYRLMGTKPEGTPVFPQQDVQVLPTRSVYQFADGHVAVRLTFMTADLPDDLDVLSRPLSYITWEVRALDGAAHEVRVLDTVSAQLAVNSEDQLVTWERKTFGSLTGLHIGTSDQPVLERSGDDVRIDWGYALLVAPGSTCSAAIAGEAAVLGDFTAHGALTLGDDTRKPRAVRDDQPVMAVALDFGQVGATPVAQHAMVGYDEVYAIKYFGTKLRPFWRRDGATVAELFQSAERDYPSLVKRCEQFDGDLVADLTRIGGERYAQICSLAYRECIAANGIAADGNRQPLMFTKENTSNGDIATVDVIFPMDPLFIMLSPTLAKASLVPILAYAASPRWKFPNSPHDLGTYPIARGTDDGGEQMPVEESGNMLILCDAIAKSEGSTAFVDPWWPQLTQWAKFLEQYGLDPENQLCTDDFMGHLAHNANLSIKAILALAAFGDLCRQRGDAATAERYASLAKADAQHWITASQDGGHSRLAFDRPGTWSQKYNLVWDAILDLHVFPPEVARSEIAYYLSVMQHYGVPLDSRTHLTKTDWTLWSATMAENQGDFERLIAPIYAYLDTTTARSPLVDSYVTDDVHSDGMKARPVIGGVFIKALSDAALWKKWASRDHAKVGPWLPIPGRPQFREVIPTSQQAPLIWHYTLQHPPEGWTRPDFDDHAWSQGPALIGNGVPNVKTSWKTDDIWLRRQVVVPEGRFHRLAFLSFHDEDVDIYLDGLLAGREGGYTVAYEPIDMRDAAIPLFKPGATLTVSVHCHQTVGGQGIDVGVIDILP
jgi:hypothetical protein